MLVTFEIWLFFLSYDSKFQYYIHSMSVQYNSYDGTAMWRFVTDRGGRHSTWVTIQKYLLEYFLGLYALMFPTESWASHSELFLCPLHEETVIDNCHECIFLSFHTPKHLPPVPHLGQLRWPKFHGLIPGFI